MSSCIGYVGNPTYVLTTLLASHSVASLVGSVTAMPNHNSMKLVPVFPRNTYESLGVTGDQMALIALTYIVRLSSTNYRGIARRKWQGIEGSD